MENVNCNLCGKKTPTKLWAKGKSKRFKDDSKTYKIVKCKKCGLIYSNPRLTPKELEEYYGKSYVANRSKGGKKKNSARKEMYALELDDLLEQLDKQFGRTNVDFLDVGCSNGAFLKSLDGTDIVRYATEFSKPAATEAQKRVKGIKKIWTGDLLTINFDKKKFDVVHLRAVFEHVSDPMATLRKAHQILKKEGMLILSTTPNAGSPAAKLFKYRWTLTKPEEHIYYYTDKTIDVYLAKTGFKRVKTSYPYWGNPILPPNKGSLELHLELLNRKRITRVLEIGLQYLR
jgi:SAM-dependent methyltransferase